jgi:AcrR family transcriptional regulator
MNRDDTTRKRIITTAIKLFSELGYDRTSMRLIAEESGVTKPAIYYYFPDKDHLFEGILHYGLDHVKAIVTNLVESKKSAREKLKAILLSRFDGYDQHPEIIRFFSELITGRIRCYRPIEIKQIIDEQERFLRTIVDENITSGFFRADINADSFIYCLLGALNMYSRDYFFMNKPKMTTEQADKLLDTLFYGVKN